VNAILFVSPGVGLDWDFVDRIMPGATVHLRAGGTIIHPGVKVRAGTHMLTVGQGEGGALLNYEEILAYKNTCPVNKAGTINLPSTSIGIVHGLYDRMVPCENSVRLARKLSCRCAHASIYCSCCPCIAEVSKYR
jgi:hypothetical protein